MAYIGTVDGKEYKVEIKNISNNLYEATITDKDGNETKLVLDVVGENKKVFSVLYEGQSIEVDLDEIDDNTYEVLVDGVHFEINIMDEMKKKLAAIVGEAGIEEGEVKTSMPGKVTKVLAEEGQQVKKGQPIVVIEAMKMENEFKAPKDGILKSLKVKEGDTVNSGAVLFIIE